MVASVHHLCTLVHTVEDILNQAKQAQNLPALNKAEFVPQALALLEHWLAHPPEGIRPGWPATLRRGPFGYVRADDSVYYPALLCVHLQELEPRMSPTEVGASARIRSSITAQFGLYRSVPGLDSYAFWQTRPVARFFPFGSRFAHDAFFRPPDDADDTCLIYQAAQHTAAQQRWLKEERLPAHSNLSAGRRAINGMPAWQALRGYCIYFADRMPLNYDVAVLANIMGWVLHSGQPLNAHDEASLHILADTVERRLYISHPYQISPYYGRPAQIAYVLARLLATRQHPSFAVLRPQLAEGVADLLSAGPVPGEALLLGNAAAMLGASVAPQAGKVDTGLLTRLPIFQYPVAAEFDLWLARRITHQRYLHVDFICPAFNLMAYVEGVLMGRGLDSQSIN